MENLVIKVQSRETVGTGSATKLRAQGRIPVNLYGPSGNRSLSVDKVEFRLLAKEIAGQTTLFEIETETGERVRSLIQEVQRNAISREVTHIDLREVAKGVEITAHVVVRVKGESFGVKSQGGLIEIVADQVMVRCLPRHLPHEILIDVTELQVGQSVHMRELPACEGVTYVGDADQVVVACVGASKMEEAEGEAEGAEAATA
ncbi:MAG: 50S ribosomal protein L25 [Opitutales bacterium]|nr:50S ribosomal protein L25 [Opitutales bacterium]